MGNLEKRMDSIDCVLKNIVDQSGVILRATADNLKILLEKLENNKKKSR